MLRVCVFEGEERKEMGEQRGKEMAEKEERKSESRKK